MQHPLPIAHVQCCYNHRLGPILHCLSQDVTINHLNAPSKFCRGHIKCFYGFERSVYKPSIEPARKLATLFARHIGEGNL